MMLRYMGLSPYAQRIEMACFDVIREGRVGVSEKHKKMPHHFHLNFILLLYFIQSFTY